MINKPFRMIKLKAFSPYRQYQYNIPIKILGIVRLYTSTNYSFNSVNRYNKLPIPYVKYTRYITINKETATESTCNADKIAPVNKEKTKLAMGDIWGILKVHLWPKGRPDIHRLVVGSFLCILVTKVIKVTIPFWFKIIIDELASNNQTLVASWIGNFTVSIFTVVCVYGIAKISSTITNELQHILFIPVSNRASNHISLEIFKKLHAKDVEFHITKKTGLLTRDLDRGSNAFRIISYDVFFSLIPMALEMMLVCVLLYHQTGAFFVITSTSSIFLYSLWTYVITQWRIKFRKAFNKLDAEISGHITETLLNYETVKISGTEKMEADRLNANNLKLNKARMNLTGSMYILNIGQNLIFAIISTIVVYYGTSSVVAGTMSIGDIILVDALLVQLFQPLKFLGVVYRDLTTSIQNLENLMTLLKSTDVIKNEEHKPKLQLTRGDIEFRNVTFHYQKNKPIINNISVAIPGGSKVALVGASGCGKSSLFKLLFRFYDAVEGDVLIDGQSVKECQLDSVRRCLSMIPQDVVLFNATLYDNITYGSSSVSNEQVHRACKQAQLLDTVRNLPDGFDTIVGERGLVLSGGEKQRVAIARALLQDRPIILADEMTAALDTTTEQHIISHVHNSLKEKTIIFIAHRISSIQNCDIIFVLNNHNVEDYGTHSELLSRKGLYYTLWLKQKKNN